MVNDKTTIVQKCANCGKQRSFLDGTFDMVTFKDGTTIELFICDKCHPDEQRYFELVKKAMK